MDPELLKTITVSVIGSLIGSAAVFSGAVFIIKKYFEKWLENEFRKREEIDRKKIDAIFKFQDSCVEKQIGVYPEIHEVTYRLKNIMREGIQKEHAYEWSPDLRPLCAHLTENLYRYRPFISPQLFDALHEFKRIAQDALLMCDISTREDVMFDKAEYGKQTKQFAEKFKRAEVLFSKISEEVTSRFQYINKI